MELQVPACEVVIRNFMFKFIGRIEKSTNDIMKVLVDPASCIIRPFATHLHSGDTGIRDCMWLGMMGSVHGIEHVSFYLSFC